MSAGARNGNFRLVEAGEKSLRRRGFPPALDTLPEPLIWSFASLGGFVIRSIANALRLFLGSSAVEHSTVNRMVAGSNPARGATRNQMVIPVLLKAPRGAFSVAATAQGHIGPPELREPHRFRKLKRAPQPE